MDTTDTAVRTEPKRLSILEEDVLSLTEASRSLPAVNGKRPDPSTLWRWARKGLHGIRLEYARLGRRIVTSREALSRFAQRLADADAEPRSVRAKTPRADRPQNQKRREADIDRAEASLRKAGI